MTTRIIPRDLLDAMRDAFLSGDVTEMEARRIAKALLIHIDAIRTHKHIFKWSEVKAAKAEARSAVCHICGETSRPEADLAHIASTVHDALNRRAGRSQEELAERLGKSPVVADPGPVIADGTRGMERGR